jgi:hypothetical protein
MTTRFGRQWKLGEWQYASGKGHLWDEGAWLTAYESPLLAALFNPVADNFPTPHVFEAKPRGNMIDDYGTRFGAMEMLLVQQLPSLPEVSIQRRIKFGLLCAIRSTQSERFGTWAEKWLLGEDRRYEEAGRVARVENIPWYAQMEIPRAFVSAAVWAAMSAATPDPDDARIYASAAAAKAAAEFWCDTHMSLDLHRLSKEAVS